MNATEPPADAASPLAEPAVGPSRSFSPLAGAPGHAVSRTLVIVVAVVAALALLLSVLLWQKLSNIQGQLARQSADSGARAVEAGSMAKQALDLARETAARQAVADERLSEVTLQRTQLEDLMQSLSRTRDDNLVVDLDSAIRLAQQQAQLTGSVAPLLAALKTADQRVIRAAQPRLAPVQRAIEHDIDRVTAARVTDTPGLLDKLDDLVRLVDDLPVVNAAASPAAARSAAPQAPAVAPAWWQRALEVLHVEARSLLRVSRIEQPEAMLLSPEQSFFLRENLKLKLLNARLGLLARQMDSARSDLAAASMALNKYFDPAARKTQAVAGLLQEAQSQMKTVELPRVDDTLAALATAAAGR
ncbi:MAG: uroporphyrinogen-III C-methyltransferase [Rhodoferax sp.]|nr:uroporphyrinogen-III C-methyltransferase [Rhodoferax sp.]